MTTFPSNYQKISKTQQVFSPHSYYHTLPLAKIRKKEARNVSSSKIIPPETPYRFKEKSEHGTVPLRERKRTTRIFITEHESSSIRVDIDITRAQRSKFIFIDREEQSSKKGRKTCSIREHARWNSLAIFVSFGVRGFGEEREKARWRCRNKEISGVTRHEFSCKARVHYDLSNPHCRHAAFLDARPRRMAKVTSRLMPIGVVLTRAVR